MNDEMNVRKINDLDVVDAIPAGSSLLINDDGTAKLLKADVLNPFYYTVTGTFTWHEASGDDEAHGSWAFTCDKTFAEIKEAFQNGRRVLMNYKLEGLPDNVDDYDAQIGKAVFYIQKDIPAILTTVTYVLTGETVDSLTTEEVIIAYKASSNSPWQNSMLEIRSNGILDLEFPN